MRRCGRELFSLISKFSNLMLTFALNLSPHNLSLFPIYPAFSSLSKGKVTLNLLIKKFHSWIPSCTILMYIIFLEPRLCKKVSLIIIHYKIALWILSLELLTKNWRSIWLYNFTIIKIWTSKIIKNIIYIEN